MARWRVPPGNTKAGGTRPRYFPVQCAPGGGSQAPPRRAPRSPQLCGPPAALLAVSESSMCVGGAPPQSPAHRPPSALMACSERRLPCRLRILGWYFSGAHSLAGASSLPDGRSLLLAVGCPLKVTNTFIDTPERGCRVPHLLSSVLCASGPALPCAARCGSAPPTTALWSWAS